VLLKLLAVVAALASAPAQPAPQIVFAADRAPSVTGEVYRVPLAGGRIDLSRSPFPDTQPVVSPDGRWVAFLSARDGGTAIYRVRPDGTALQRISTALPLNGGEVQTAWAPDSKRLAVVTAAAPGSALFVVTPGSGQRLVARADVLLQPSWSPDGRVLTVSEGAFPNTSVAAYAPDGRRLWRVPNATSPPGWSAHALFAALWHGRVNVYDEAGRRVVSFAGRAAAWSPDGSLLASLTPSRLEVHTTSGRLVEHRAVPRQELLGIVWVAARRVVAGGTGVDVSTGRSFTPNKLAFAVRSRDGRLVAYTTPSGAGFALRVARSDGGRARTVAHVPGCFDDGGPDAAIASLQFAPDGHSLVYESRCAEPFDNLYAVAPDGSALRRLTTVNAQQTTPAWSPDGMRIAYSRAQYTGLSCKGCPSSIWIADADGSHPRAVTDAPDTTYDVAPSWSADGKQIVFSRSSAVSPSELYVVAATGGPLRDLRVAGADPAWGAQRIAFVDDGLWTVSPDGSDRRKIASGTVSLPAWSADGRLAYVASTARGTNPVAVVVDGAATRRVPLPFTSVFDLGWAPDGTRFVVAARAAGSAAADVYTIPVGGGTATRITTNVNASGASWRA
jgi:TolB protein